MLECLESNFLQEVTNSPASRDVILDLIIPNAAELIGDDRSGGSLG